jgi:hypothetical protein
LKFRDSPKNSTTLRAGQAAWIRVLNGMAVLSGIAEVVGGDCLLGERGEVSGPSIVAEIDQDCSVLPDIVVVVVVVLTVVQKRASRTLVHVDVVNPEAAARVGTAEDVNVGVTRLRLPEESHQGSRGFRTLRAVHDITVAPPSGLSEDVTSEKVECRQGMAPREVMESRFRRRERAPKSMAEVENEPVLEQIVRVIRPDVDRGVPVLRTFGRHHLNGGVNMVLGFLTDLRL